MNSRFILQVLLVFCLLTLSCRNPYMPPTGVPITTNQMRVTPQGVINQLIESYEKRQITLYQDLFPKDGSFRFFVAPAFITDNPTKYQKLSETRDPRLKYIGQSPYYYYWTQVQEVESHRKLFSQAASIEFVEKPVVQSVDKFVDGGDSLAEGVVTGGYLEISRQLDVTTIEYLSSSIGQQVFLMQKDDEDLWVISKWYDFSSN